MEKGSDWPGKNDEQNKGKKCQDCHMSWRKEMLPYDNYIVDGGARRMWGSYRSARNIIRTILTAGPKFN